MLSKSFLFLFILAITLCKLSAIGFKCNAKRNMNRQFETLMFVQQWPITYCTNLMNDGNECKSPPQKGIWTIHGIWPSRFDTNVNDQPACCDSSINIKWDELQAIKEQLKRYWPSVQNDKPDEDFWEYEWLKHGTCSVSIDELNSSIKYFQQALYWLKEYNMSSILAKSNIIPHNEKSYKLLDIYTAVKSVLNKSPSINCYIDSATNEQFLNEIRICFDNNLQLIDCDGIEKPTSKYNVATNCRMDKPINYRVDFLDQSSHWFLSCLGLVIFFVVILLMIRNLRHRFHQNSESINLVQNNIY